MGVRSTLLLALLLAFLPLLFVYQSHLNHDVGLFLTAGTSLLEGRRPAVDLVDVNPPLIIYLNVVPALLARLTGWSVVLAGQLSVLVVIAGSLLAFRCLLPLAPCALDAAERALFSGFWILANLVTYAADEFGQREHIFVLLCTPFLLLRLSRHAGAKVRPVLALALGLAAFLGSALKPHFVVTLLTVELFLLLRSRRWRALAAPEAFAYAIAGFVYAAHFLVVPGLSEYLTRWMPLLAEHYSAYGTPWPTVMMTLFRQQAYQLGFVLAVFSTYLAVRVRAPLTGMLGALGFFFFCSAVFFVYQAKGWAYHLVPLWFSVFLLAATLLIWFGQLLVAHPAEADAPRGLPSTLILSALVGVAVFMFPNLPLQLAGRQPPQRGGDAFYDALLLHTRPRDPVLFLSPSSGPAFPAMTMADRRPGSRYLDTFPLALFYHDATDYRPWEETPPGEQRFYRELVDDVQRLKPRLVFVSTRPGPQGCPRFFTVDEYLRRRGFYREALAPYSELEAIGQFRVFLRRPETGRP